jgi:diguanylate cyclase (GGDEF)-like protein
VRTPFIGAPKDPMSDSGEGVEIERDADEGAARAAVLRSELGLDERLLPSLRCAIRLLRAATGVANAAFVLFGQDRRPLVMTHQGDIGDAREAMFEQCLRTVKHPTGWVYRPRADTPDGRLEFFAGMPVATAGRLAHGVVCVFDARRRPFEAVARQALRDARELVEQDIRARQEASYDFLTGLYNRRHLTEALEREWRRALREQTPLSVLAVDVDHFKAFNDTYGHRGGDEALRAVAAQLRATLHRPADVLSRTGGEEFLACLGATDSNGAQRAAESMRRAVADLNMAHAGSPHERLTVSIGVATAHPAAALRCSVDDLQEAADRALYRAKHEGRNRVVAADLDATAAANDRKSA